MNRQGINTPKRDSKAVVVGRIEKYKHQKGESNLRFTERQERLYRFLKIGRLNAQTAQEIEKGTGIKYRTVYDVVKQLRKKGIPIVSERHEIPQGYYIAELESDIRMNRMRIESEIRELQKTWNYLDKLDRPWIVTIEKSRHEKSFVHIESDCYVEKIRTYTNKNRAGYKLNDEVKVVVTDQTSGFDYEVYRNERLVRVGYEGKPFSFAVEKLLKEIKEKEV